MRTEKQRPKSWKEVSESFEKNDWRMPFTISEWACKWAVYWLSRRAWLEVLEYVGKMGILFAVIAYIYPGCEERKQATESAKQAAADARKSRHYVAWQTINSAVGKPGNGGRTDALQDLNQDGIQLDGISLSGNVVLVGPLNLTNASMTHADFSDGVIQNVNFSRANLYSSKWNNASFENCDFRGAFLWSVVLSHTKFMLCDFSFADDGKMKKSTDFGMQSPGSDGSDFTLCNFAGSDFGLSIWDSISFGWCNFAYANLSGVSIGNNVSSVCCNLFGATASPDFIKWASHQHAVFTNVVSLEDWHYCVTNKIALTAGGSEFMNWASNQFSIYNRTNDTQAWLNWSRENLKN